MESYDENSELFKEIAKESKEDSRIRIMGRCQTRN